MLQGTLVRLVAAGLVAGGTLWAGEYALLNTGFRLRAERHELAGDRIRLFRHDGGVVELPASRIVRFEQDDYMSPPPPAKTLAVDKPLPLDALIEKLASEQSLHPALLHSVIEAESAYNPDAVSPKGAIGLMQLMPQTAQELKVHDARDPGQNVTGGATYLKQLLHRYQGTGDPLLRALAAYNAGPARVDHHNGLPPFDETRLFVKRVIERFLARAKTEAPN